MSKRKRLPPSKPSNAYLISFGDTMTAMLAFFIVLNTLAQEQTGANLHAGTGSFVTAVRAMGLPGMFSGNRARRVMSQKESGPVYVVDDGQRPEVDAGDGPDSEANQLRVRDRDAEQLQRMIVELEQQFQVDSRSESLTQVAFDLFERLQKPPHRLPTSARRVLARAMPLISNPAYHVQIDVWSPTPSISALTRTVDSAKQIRQEILRDFAVFQGRPAALRTSARIWPYSDQRRPVLSINVTKIIDRTLSP